MKKTEKSLKKDKEEGIKLINYFNTLRYFLDNGDKIEKNFKRNFVIKEKNKYRAPKLQDIHDALFCGEIEL